VPQSLVDQMLQKDFLLVTRWLLVWMDGLAGSWSLSDLGIQQSPKTLTDGAFSAILSLIAVKLSVRLVHYILFLITRSDDVVNVKIGMHIK